MTFKKANCVKEINLNLYTTQPNPGIEPRSPALQVDSLPAEPPGKPSYTTDYI